MPVVTTCFLCNTNNDSLGVRRARMKTVLTISDSVQGTIYDLIRCTNTIKEYDLDPLAIVPRIASADGTSEEMDVSEMLDYAFGECDFSVLGMGFVTEPGVINYVADKLDQNKTAPLICCPSLISDEGEVLVGGDVYSALCDRLLKHVDFLIVNTIEAEAFCGFECPAKNDYFRAAKKIYNVYGCGVFIRGNEKTDGQCILFDGSKPAWVNAVTCEPGFEDKYSLLAAIACEFALENPASLAMPLALDLVNGKKALKEKQAIEAAERKAREAAEEAERKAREAAEEAELKKKQAAEAAATKASEEAHISRTPVPRFSFGAGLTARASAESKPADTKPAEAAPAEEHKQAEHAEAAPEPEEKPIVTSSLVSPGKSIRDIARVIAPAVKPEEAEHAVTSNIEKPEEPKGEVTQLANSRLLFDSKVNDSITSLQSLKDRLNNLNKLADSGK